MGGRRAHAHTPFKARRFGLGWVDGRGGRGWAGLMVDAAAYDCLMFCLCAALALDLLLALSIFPLPDGRLSV